MFYNLKNDKINLFLVYAIIIILTAPCNSSVLNQDKAKFFLKKVDEFRTPWKEFEMNAVLSFDRRGTEVEEKFRVFFQDKIKTLVVYLFPTKQKGNLFLMVQDELWFYAKNTRRPLRISPIQRIAGSASYGDLSRLNWSTDYTAILIKNDHLVMKDKIYPTRVLELTAKSVSATYYKIMLWVEKSTNFPRKADAYLQSGKLMKTLYFTRFEKTFEFIMNKEIEFVDHLKNGKITVLKFDNIYPKEIPDKYFLKTQLPELSRKLAK